MSEVPISPCFDDVPNITQSVAKFYIYKITNKINNKIYIGKTKNLSRRWGEHKYSARNRPKLPISRAIAKYGIDNFIYESIACCISLEEANIVEMDFIDKLNSRDRNVGYNITAGGDGPAWSLESKQKLSQSKMGEKNAFFGKSHTKETRSIISKKLLGNTRRRGKITSVETKILLSKAFSGDKNPNKKLDISQVNKIRELYSTNNYTQKELSILFGVALITIARIITNRAWKDKK